MKPKQWMKEFFLFLKRPCMYENLIFPLLYTRFHVTMTQFHSVSYEMFINYNFVFKIFIIELFNVSVEICRPFHKNSFHDPSKM